MSVPSKSTRYRRVQKSLSIIIGKSIVDKNEPVTSTSAIQDILSDNLDETAVDISEDVSDTLTLLSVDSVCSGGSSSSGEELNNTGKTENPLRQELGAWACRNNITHRAVYDLLSSIHPFVNQSIPSDARTLLKTPRTKIVLQKIGQGDFYYFDVKAGILRSARHGLKKFNFPFLANCDSNQLTVSIGVDGLPLSKSSKSQFWPILGILDQSVKPCPFLIALYYGDCKPTNCNAFFTEFVTEMKELEQVDSLSINSMNFNVRISVFCADAPARSFLKQCSIFNSYHGCERCVQKGAWLKRVIFKELDSSVRTDDSFRLMSDKHHHMSHSIISELDVGLVSQVILDHMHLLFLGVMRKFLRTWVKGSLAFRVGPSNIRIMNQRLTYMANRMPKEFHRKLRPVNEIDHFKATEYRTFLLYTGLVVLFGVLSKEKYKHFLYLECAVYILLSDSANNLEWNTFAKVLLRKFVAKVPVLYSDEYLVYNVHNLLHLNEDALTYGNLNKASCFPFEDYMQTMKRFVRSKKHYIQQVVHRISEIETATLSSINGSYSRRSKKGVLWNDYFVSDQNGDNCFMIRGEKLVIICEIIKAEQHVKLKCKAFTKMTDLPSYPCKSSRLGIYRVNRLFGNLFYCDLKDLIRKCVLLPSDPSEKFLVCIPML